MSCPRLRPSRQRRSRKADVKLETVNSQVLAYIALSAMLLQVAFVVRACGTRSFDGRMVLPCKTPEGTEHGTQFAQCEKDEMAARTTSAGETYETRDAAQASDHDCGNRLYVSCARCNCPEIRIR